MSLPIPKLNKNNGVYKVSGSGFSITLPPTISSDDEPIGGVSYFEEIPGRNGLLSTRQPNFLGREIALTGVIEDRHVVNELRKVLSAKRITLEREYVVLDADVQSVSIVEQILDTLWRVTIELSSHLYYWRSKESSVINSSPTVVTNGGTLPVPPVFEVVAGTGGLASINLEIDGRQAEWTGNAASGETVIIDCENLVVTHEGANDLNNMNTNFFITPPILQPDYNTITPTINGAATYSVLFVERYL